MGDSDSDFGDEKYRFTFTFPSNQTINSKELKANIPYDFKIKKQDNSNTLTLEKAWSEDKEFAKKAGLDCATESQCSVSTTSTGSNLNVKVGNQKKEGITSLNGGSGKIKMEKDQAGYNQGLKFTITTADISLTSGTGGDAITKLEELETYEITEEGGKYYLTRKTTREESIRSSLSIPEECFKTPGSSCTLNTEQIKNINFHDKDTAGASMTSGTATLTVSKTSNTTDFPLGYKFTLLSQQEITIKNSDNKVKANVPTDFKIKKEDGKPVSLEKAWSENKFAEKVAMTCDASSNECSSKSEASEKLNVKRGTDTKTGITSFNGGSGSGKIKVEKDQAGYNQGLKFTISEGDVSLTGGNGGSFEKLEELETYEITEDGDKYYLTRKTEAIKTIESQLGLTDAGCSLSSSSSSCSLTADKLKKINFSDKEENNVSISSGNATLTIAKVTDKTDFPLGYKFTLQSTSGDITIKSSTNVVKKNISTDFKIKKGDNGGSLSLEKAWTMESLGKKVGLTCTNDTNNECSINGGDSNKLRVKRETDSYKTLKEKDLTKKTSGSSCGKIKVTKDQENYNQGFKFTVEEGKIELDGSTATDDSEKIKSLDEYETYEIKEDGGEWYLERKDKADVFILKQLGLDNMPKCTSLKLPTDSAGETCSIESLDDLKKVKFENATSHIWSGEFGNNKSVQLSISQDSGSTPGFKFTFSGSTTNACLPDGKGGKVKLDSTTTGGVDYKIKKTGTGFSATLTLEKKDGSSGSGSSSC